jgi:hypothetical protein
MRRREFISRFAAGAVAAWSMAAQAQQPHGMRRNERQAIAMFAR